jgi:hypothetical protein
MSYDLITGHSPGGETVTESSEQEREISVIKTNAKNAEPLVLIKKDVDPQIKTCNNR